MKVTERKPEGRVNDGIEAVFNCMPTLLDLSEKNLPYPRGGKFGKVNGAKRRKNLPL
jgi:hypothetical protein